MAKTIASRYIQHACGYGYGVTHPPQNTPLASFFPNVTLMKFVQLDPDSSRSGDFIDAESPDHSEPLILLIIQDMIGQACFVTDGLTHYWDIEIKNSGEIHKIGHKKELTPYLCEIASGFIRSQLQ